MRTFAGGTHHLLSSYIAGSEASSTTADQNLGHLMAANHNLDQDMGADDPEGISTSGQVDEGGASFRLVLNNEDDDEDDEDEEDEEDDEDDLDNDLLDLEIREAGEQEPVAGPSRRSNGPVLAAASQLGPPMSSDMLEPIAGSSGTGTVSGHNGIAAGLGGAPSQFASVTVGFKKPFNKKGRLLETLQYHHSHSSPSHEDEQGHRSATNVPHMSEADLNRPGPSSGSRPLNGGAVVIVTSASRPTAAFSQSFDPCLLGPSGSNCGLAVGGGVPALRSTVYSASLAPVTLSLLTSAIGGGGGGAGPPFASRSLPFYNHGMTAAKSQSAPHASSASSTSTPSVSLFPVSSRNSYPTQQQQPLFTSTHPPLTPIQRPAEASPASLRPSHPAKSYSESLGIGLAFSRLPGSSSSGVSLSAVGPAAEANKPATAAVLSGPLSKRLRTRYQDTEARTQQDEQSSLPPPVGVEPPAGQCPQGEGDLMRRSLVKQPEVSLSLLPVVMASNQPPLGVLSHKELSEGAGSMSGDVGPLFLLAEKAEDQERGEEEVREEMESDEEEEEDEEEDDDGSSNRFSFLGEVPFLIMIGR